VVRVVFVGGGRGDFPHHCFMTSPALVGCYPSQAGIQFIPCTAFMRATIPLTAYALESFSVALKIVVK